MLKGSKKEGDRGKPKPKRGIESMMVYEKDKECQVLLLVDKAVRDYGSHNSRSWHGLSIIWRTLAQHGWHTQATGRSIKK